MLSLLKCTSRIQSTFALRVHCRRYMKVSEKMEFLLKQVDNIPKTYSLIYRESEQKIFGFMYHTVIFVTCASLATISYFWYKDIPMNNDSKHFELFKSTFDTTILALGIISTTVGALWLRKTYAIRVYYNDQKKIYRVIFIGRIPLTTEYYEFPSKISTFTSRDSIFPWMKSIINCNGRKILLYEDKFKTQNYFIEMLKPGEI